MKCPYIFYNIKDFCKIPQEVYIWYWILGVSNFEDKGNSLGRNIVAYDRMWELPEKTNTKKKVTERELKGTANV